MNKRILCVALLPFCAACLLRQKGDAFLGVLFALFFAYLLLPAMMLKSGKRKKKELMIRLSVIAVSFAAGFFYTGIRVSDVEKKIASINDGEKVSVTGRIDTEKNAGTVLYMGDSLIYASNALIIDDRNENDSSPGGDYEGNISVMPGDIVRVEGRIRCFDGARNPGEFDMKEYYISQKIYSYLSAERIVLLERPAFSLRRMLMVLKDRISDVYIENLPPVQSSLVCAMALGDKSLLDEGIKDLYRAGGVSHMLVISGLHISLIGLFFYRLLRLKIPVIGACVLAACGLFFYCAVTGGSVSTVRAVMMFCIYLCAVAIGCGYDGLCSWSVALFGLLFYNPFAIGNSGFIMSFYQTGFIMCFSGLSGDSYAQRKVRDFSLREPVKILKKRALNTLEDLREAFSFTWIMTLASYPLIACFYYELPAYSPAANLLMLPAMGLVMVFAIAGGILGLFFPGAARVVLYPVRVILGADTLLCEFINTLPFSVKICGYPGRVRLVFYFLIFALILIFVSKFKNRKKKHFMILAGGSVLLLTILLFPHRTGFETDVLDVGQGDGIYISTSQDTDLFIDGGSSSEKKLGKYTIMPFLKYRGVEKIDYWFISHLDADHYNGFLECLDVGYGISNVILSRDIVKDEAYFELVGKLDEKGIDIVYVDCGDSLVMGDTVIKVLSPEGEAVKPDYSMEPDYSMNSDNLLRSDHIKMDEDRNEKSLVLIYEDTKSGFKGFFGGDIGEETEKRICENKAAEDVFFYKVSHHGSKYSNSPDFLNTISPEVSAISCSSKNKYGHPHSETLERLDAVGCKVYRTDLSGCISIKVVGEGVRMTTFVNVENGD